MLRSIISRFPVRLVVILALIITSSCLTLKTIPTNNINQLQTLRKNLIIHSEDSLWIVYHYLINGKLLSGKLIRLKEGINKLNAADIYVAPLSAVEIKGDILTVSTENIGKIDYQVPDGLIIICSFGIAIVLLLFVPLFLQ
jgi:hypothetical protein